MLQKYALKRAKRQSTPTMVPRDCV
jgi:hypothetical protein